VKPSTVRRHLTWLSRAGFLDGVERMKLTERQLDVLEFIEDYFAEHHCSPTIEEIRDGCGFGSYRTAWEKVSALNRKDFIDKEMYKERGIHLK
jgi:SOS-response transcriptional repressor LexA